MVQKDNYLFCAELGNLTYGAIKILDISNADNIYVADDFYPISQPWLLSLDGNLMVSSNLDKSWTLFDVTDPLNITELFNYPVSDFINAISIHGNALYTYLNNASTPLDIYDITDPASPVYQWSITFPDGVDDISYYGNYMYVATGAAVEVYSILDPFHPSSVGSYSYSVLGYNDIEIRSNLMYVLGDKSLEIVSLGIPDSPSYIGGITLTPPDTFYDVLEVDGQFAYVTGSSEKLYSVQVFPPSGPSLIGEIIQGQFYGGRGLLAYDGYLYEGTESLGLRIFDLY
jgi:hypothetical protein